MDGSLTQRRRKLAKTLVGICAVLASGLGACAGRQIVVNDIEVYEHYWQQAVEQVGRRAAFDLRCPRDYLQFTLFAKRGRYPTQVGVDGCGSRAMYVRFLGPAYTGPWRMDAASSQLAPMAPAAAR